MLIYSICLSVKCLWEDLRKNTKLSGTSINNQTPRPLPSSIPTRHEILRYELLNNNNRKSIVAGF